MKKAKGFTLVELIVVIAIIGVLAAILVPAMMGWISKANLRTANSGAKQIYTNAQTIMQEIEDRTALDDPTSGVDAANNYVWYDNSTYSITNKTSGGAGDSPVNKEMQRKMADSKNAKWGVCFANGSSSDVDLGTCVGAFFCKDGNYKYVGTYPEWSANTKSNASLSGSESALKQAVSVYKVKEASGLSVSTPTGF